jgi:hypothetical protein
MSSVSVEVMLSRRTATDDGDDDDVDDESGEDGRTTVVQSRLDTAVIRHEGRTVPLVTDDVRMRRNESIVRETLSAELA